MKHCKLSVSDRLTPLPDSVTLCATVDESGDEHVITELMIRRACEQMDATQSWPYVGKTLNTTLQALPAGGAKVIPFSPRLN